MPDATCCLLKLLIEIFYASVVAASVYAAPDTKKFSRSRIARL
jgi:hypothetical protein